MLAAAIHGVLVIDKPVGPTSHDVVARVRRTLETRAVGHAGTLDPAASGVLVVAVGEATKLVPYLTSQRKTYEATVALGRSTTTLDAEGDIVNEAAAPAELAREIETKDWGPSSRIGVALDLERARREQVPPAFSAIKLQGRPAHERARRGEAVEIAPRPVEVFELEVAGARAAALDLRLEVSKGYYVRSLARDLGDRLGVPAHLSALRRVASGAFTLADARAITATREELVAALEPTAKAAARVLPVGRLSADGCARARRGQPIGREHFVAPPGGGTSVWVGPSGDLVAIGRSDEPDRFVVTRGFGHSTSIPPT